MHCALASPRAMVLLRHRATRMAAVALLSAAWLAWPLAGLASSAASPSLFPIEQVRAGLTGYGLTVVEGTQVERFDVRVLGLVRRAGPAGDLILIRVSGPVIDRAGGIAAGMSGSPVYVDGRLLGAVGFAFEYSDHSVGMVTPIGDMLPVLDLLQASPPAGIPAPELGQDEVGGLPAYRQVAVAENFEQAERLAASLGSHTAIMVPVVTPVIASGFGPRAQEALERLLAPYATRLIPTPGASAWHGATGSDGNQGGGQGAPAALEPGSAFGVSLVQGDIDLTAIGTVTYVDGDRFIGFGHPFLQAGPVDFFAGPAFIFSTVKAVDVPFKLGSLLGVTGVVRQDRRAAVAGVSGQQPDSIALSVQLEDETAGRATLLQAHIVRDDLLTVPLAAIATLEALDRGLDRIGPGTARVIYRIRGSNLPGNGSFSADNMYFSRVDISARLLTDLLDALQALMFNRFQDVHVDAIDVQVQVEQAQRTAAIVQARPLSQQVEPGQHVGIEVELLPFRGSKETRIVTLEVPKEAAPGPVTVTVRGGTAASFTLPSEVTSVLTGQLPSSSQDQPSEGDATGEVPSSLEKLMEVLASRERNNQIVAEFYPGFTSNTGASTGSGKADDSPPGSGRLPTGGDSEEGAKQTAEAAPASLEQPVKASLITPWVIEGSADIELDIVARPSQGSDQE